tara:strand:- start:10316 stop:11206 length:891 start_codon:yes stop_codon:yes gene_type:complete
MLKGNTVIKEASENDILCFGCSFTGGIESRYSWPMKLAIDHPNLEIYNFGLGGNSTMVSGFLLDAYLNTNKLKPKFIFFQVSRIDRLAAFLLGGFRIHGIPLTRYKEVYDYFNPVDWLFSTNKTKLKELDSLRIEKFGTDYKLEPERPAKIDIRQPDNYFRWPSETTTAITEYRWESLAKRKIMPSWLRGYRKFFMADFVESCYKFKINILHIKHILQEHNIPHIMYTQTAELKDQNKDNEYRVVKDFLQDVIDFEIYEELDLKPYHIDNGYHLNDKGIDIQAELLFKKMVSKNDK